MSDKRANMAIQATNNGGGAFVPASMEGAVEFAHMMAKADKMLPRHLRNETGACLAIVMQAARWEMDPFAVANKSYFVNDRVAYEAQLIAAVLNTRAPIQGRIHTKLEGEGPTRRACAYATFVGETEVTEVWTPLFKDITPKNSPLWKTDPDQQLSYYAKRLFARRECPEVLLGVYDNYEVAEPVHQGFDNARNVTPPEPAADPLAALNSMVEAPEPEAEPEIPYDTETGEIITEPEPESELEGALL